MMRKEIKYIGFYDVHDSVYKRNCALPATNKMDYIAEAIGQAGFKVHVVSPSWFVDSSSHAKFHPEKTVLLDENKKITFAPSFGTSNKIIGYVKIVFGLLWLFLWLSINTNKNEKIIVYHSPWLVLPILLAKKIKRLHLILEVEEIYSDVSSLHPYFDKLERCIFAKADSFLFSTELLSARLKNNKPYKVIYGNYKVYDRLALPINDGKIHLLYAGIIDSHKAGAFHAIESALYLPEKYVMRIIGFGEVKKLLLRINEINKIAKCKVVYDGIKINDEFASYCQSCHIGLSTQKMQGDYVSSSFPSKILTYLGLGLSVVTCSIDVVLMSKINEYVHYYHFDTPGSIAEAILTVDNINTDKNTSIISMLNDDFIYQLKSFLINT